MDSTPLRASSSLQNTSPDQNPAEVIQLRAKITYQNEVLQGFQERLVNLRAAN